MRIFVAGASGAIGRPLVAKLRHGRSRGDRHDTIRACRRGDQDGRGHGSRGRRVRRRRGAGRGRRGPARRARPRAHCPPRALPAAQQGDPTTPPTGCQPRARGTPDRRTPGRPARGALSPEHRLPTGPLRSPMVVAEDAPLFMDAPAPFGDAVQALEEMGAPLVLGADSLEGVVLRYGWFYGPAPTSPRMALPCATCASGASRWWSWRRPWSFIHVDDAADATVASVERGAAGVYNVVDDEPGAMRDWLPILAEAPGPATAPRAGVAGVAGGRRRRGRTWRRCFRRRATRRTSASSAGSPRTRASAAGCAVTAGLVGPCKTRRPRSRRELVGADRYRRHVSDLRITSLARRASGGTRATAWANAA